ncbi:sodium-dependent transporter [Microaceticoccus formicicus]|uniref:sodium-dependent transporter n=1 Tax=Microaceticoccus formicicus TaxID=3118105 RepID=UPI003CD01AB0|nr:sodium-dependent transporter [Peptoniphilaceae bacterium AMB_02]
MVDKTNNRDHWNSRTGFILACVGSAVGMGNIWLFPYKTGKNGGAAFLIPYFLFVIILGYTGVIEEMALGRAYQSGPMGAFKKSFEKKGMGFGHIIGLIPVLGSVGIAIGYAVVVGWILRFTVGSFTGAVTGAADSGAYFGMIAGPYGSLVWHVLGLIITFAIMLLGVSSGIEKVNKFMMPAFFLLFIVLAVRVFFLPGSAAGYEFLFKPDWSLLLKPMTWVFALGQAFFSLSLAGSGTVAYGSYLSPKEDIPYSAKLVALLDTVAAMLAALVIIPAVFAFNLEPGAGPPLMFITMPQVFKAMPAGQLFSIIFFVAVLFAGVTSLMNLFETAVETLQTYFKLSRLVSVVIMAVLGFGVGVFLEDGGKLGDWMDMVSIYLIPLGALLASIVFFWINGDDFAKEQASIGASKPLGDNFVFMGKYIFCGLTAFVFIIGLFVGSIG